MRMWLCSARIELSQLLSCNLRFVPSSRMFTGAGIYQDLFIEFVNDESDAGPVAPPIVMHG